VIGISHHQYIRHDDDESLKDWILMIVDESPDRLAIIKMPVVTTDDELDELEEEVRRAYDLAKDERPNLSVKLLHGVDTGGPHDGESRVIVVIHEHKWVAGQCVNGCPDTRKDG
jgi:hypothetical protein